MAPWSSPAPPPPPPLARTALRSLLLPLANFRVLLQSTRKKKKKRGYPQLILPGQLMEEGSGMMREGRKD